LFLVAQAFLRLLLSPLGTNCLHCRVSSPLWSESEEEEGHSLLYVFFLGVSGEGNLRVLNGVETPIRHLKENFFKTLPFFRITRRLALLLLMWLTS